MLDIVMPGMSGLEVLDRLRESPKTTGIPVILVSAKVRVEGRPTVSGTGASYHVPKPFSRQQLLDAVRLVLASPPPGSVRSAS